ncbi:XRE family transcriptional regulator [Bartonella choladocola]|uniref:Phage repressor protein C n=1 Tax=Bartonella choladocola TaxID=2750995 RepID=A0A1U9MJL2_9HYPH|nr:helix-turn-helix transcriptional regulator [Bartonella choladocola]AQT47862.1 Phage repressor protein C [Bartonella choladocola]
MSLKTRIFEARKKAHLTQNKLASLVHVTKAAVSAWEHGTSPHRDKLEAIAKATNVSLEWLLLGDKNAGEYDSRQISDRPAIKLIPVYGQAVAGINGEFSFDGKKLFEVPCPPCLLNVENAYGVEVAGDTMSPRYEDGEIVYIDTVRRIKKDDYVVAKIMMREEDSFPTVFIKRFIRHNEQELVLAQLNPAKELVFPHQHVLSVHYIALAGEGL